MTLNDKLQQIYKNVPVVHQAGVNNGYAQREGEWQQQYLDNGAREDYTSAFAGASWNVDSFRPSMDIIPKDSWYMFHYHNCGFWGMAKDAMTDDEKALLEASRYDLVERLAECGVTLDFSNCKLMKKTFYGANISHVGVIDFKSVKTYWAKHDDGTEHECGKDNWRHMFGHSWITKIDKLIFYPTNPSFCSCWLPEGLVDVTVEGTIKGNNLNLSYCKDITHDSIMQFINHLDDQTDCVWYDSWDIWLGAENYAKLTAAEIKIATDKGWNVHNTAPA